MRDKQAAATGTWNTDTACGSLFTSSCRPSDKVVPFTRGYIRRRSSEQADIDSGLGGHRYRWRHRLRGVSARARRIRQCRLAGHCRIVGLFHCLPVLQQVSSPSGAAARRHATDTRRPAQRRHGLRADEQMGALRAPFRGDRGRRPAGRSGAGGTDGIPAWNVVDPRRRGRCRSRAGLHRAVCFRASRWQVTRGNDQDGAGPRGGFARSGRRARDHDHHPGGAEPHRRQGADREPLGPLHNRGNDPDCAGDGRVYARYPAGTCRRSLGVRRDPVARLDPLRAHGRRGRCVGPVVHPDRDRTGLGTDHLRRNRGQPAGVVDVGATRLPVHVPQDRHRGRAGDRYLCRRPAARDADRPRASSMAAGRCFPDRFSRSSSSPLRAARCPASIR